MCPAGRSQSGSLHGRVLDQLVWPVLLQGYDVILAPTHPPGQDTSFAGLKFESIYSFSKGFFKLEDKLLETVLTGYKLGAALLPKHPQIPSLISLSF